MVSGWSVLAQIEMMAHEADSTVICPGLRSFLDYSKEDALQWKRKVVQVIESNQPSRFKNVPRR